MVKRELDVEIMKGHQHQESFQVNADPDDAGTLRDVLTGWLASHGWQKSRWGEFELHARYRGEGKIRRKVRGR